MVYVINVLLKLFLLFTKPKNAASREELKKGTEDGITVRGLGHEVLSKELYQEAIILSDMYNMNEFAALDLLCTAQLQLSFYPNLSRGLVAVLLYYDGRKSLLLTLRMLVQARKGILWKVPLQPELEEFVTTYTDQLMEGGLFSRIFNLLKSLDLSKEIEMLHQNIALGDAKHQRQVTTLFIGIKQILAEIVFLWSSQTGLPKHVTLSLISHLRLQKIEEEASGKLDNISLYLLSAFLAAVDLNILQVREDADELVQKLPIIAEEDFINSVSKELLSDEFKWECEGLHANALLGFAVCIASLRLVPQNRSLESSTESEDMFVDAALNKQVSFHVFYLK